MIADGDVAHRSSLPTNGFCFRFADQLMTDEYYALLLALRVFGDKGCRLPELVSPDPVEVKKIGLTRVT